MLDLSRVVAHLPSCCRVLTVQVGVLALASHKAHTLSLLCHQPPPCLLYAACASGGADPCSTSSVISHVLCCCVHVQVGALALLGMVGWGIYAFVLDRRDDRR